MGRIITPAGREPKAQVGKLMTATAELKPLATWDGDVIVAGLAWWSRLDGRYLIEVQYDPKGQGYQGTLAIFDHQDNDRLIHAEPVGIMFAARFGPDVSDVGDWQERAATVVDALA